MSSVTGSVREAWEREAPGGLLTPGRPRKLTARRLRQRRGLGCPRLQDGFPPFRGSPCPQKGHQFPRPRCLVGSRAASGLPSAGWGPASPDLGQVARLLGLLGLPHSPPAQGPPPPRRRLPPRARDANPASPLSLISFF